MSGKNVLSEMTICFIFTSLHRWLFGTYNIVFLSRQCLCLDNSYGAIIGARLTPTKEFISGLPIHLGTGPSIPPPVDP